jgi:hypothetical protein
MIACMIYITIGIGFASCFKDLIIMGSDSDGKRVAIFFMAALILPIGLPIALLWDKTHRNYR